MAARKTIIVTGASRGIGHATALRFHREGWRVITVSRTPPPGQCPWSRERSHILLDLSDLGNIVRCIEIMRGMLEGGELHATRQQRGDLAEGTGRQPARFADDRHRHLAVDVQHQLLRAAAADPRLRRELSRGRGAVVNLTSIAGSRVHQFAGSAYATSKAALAALTREMAFDLAPLGVRVNAIAPGEIDTAILSPGTPEIVERDIPLRRLGTIDEVADLIWFLCSTQASYITGAEIPINGGQHV